MRSKFADSTQVDVIHTNKKEMESIDALLFANKVTVMEGLELLRDSSNEGTTFTIKATVIGIAERSTWFYMACPRCTKAHLMKDGCPWCRGCQRKVRNPVPRYKLQLIVTDNTSKADIIVSGPATEPLLNDVRVSKLMEISSIDIKALQSKGTADMDWAALADLAEKGLQNKNHVEPGAETAERKDMPGTAQHGDMENLEDEAALAEIEAKEKTIQNGEKDEDEAAMAEKEAKEKTVQSGEREAAQHADNENLEDKAALAELEAAEKTPQNGP